MEHSLTVEPAREIEVSVSVYGSHEPSPSPPTEAAHSTSSSELTLLNEVPHRDNTSPQPTTQPEAEVSPPPLPSPMEENEAALATHTDANEGEMMDERDTKIHHNEEERGGETGTCAVLFSGIPISAVVGKHLDSSGSSSSTISGASLVEKDNREGEKHQLDVPALPDSQEQDKRQHSSSLSEYHTPSSITDDELKLLSHRELVTQTDKKTLPVGDERPAGGEQRDKDTTTAEEHWWNPVPVPRFLFHSSHQV